MVPLPDSRPTTCAAEFRPSSTRTWPTASAAHTPTSCVPRRVIVGRDIRLSSEELSRALEQGLLDSGVDVYDVGLCGTEVVYFATFSGKMDGGVMVTASHNPPDYNGMKFVREESRPISGDNGLQDIRRMAEAARFDTPVRIGERYAMDVMPAYVEHLLSYVDSGEAQAPQGGRPRRQRRRRADRRQAAALPALRVHQGAARARRQLSERRAEPDAGREPSCTGRGAAGASRRPGRVLGRRLRPLLPVRRARRLHRGLLHRGPARRVVPAASSRRNDRPRSAAHLEHARHREGARRPRGAVQVRARLHQAAHARSGRCLRRRDERTSLLP